MRIGIIILALLATALIVGCGREPKLTPVPPGETVLAFGDSVTFGTGAAPGEDWPTGLALKTGWNLINAGVPGDTAEAGKSRIADLLDQHQPALVIIEMGGNDFLRHRPQRAVKEDVRHLLRTVRQSGAQAVLVAVPELSLLTLVIGKGDAPLYQELAEEEAVPVIGQVFSEILSRPELRADQIHPNAEGYRQMASGIYDYLKKAGAI
ncbi:MAG: GDSL-type esterase/lipase family protein [Chromatiaceae bacterium]